MIVRFVGEKRVHGKEIHSFSGGSKRGSCLFSGVKTQYSRFTSLLHHSYLYLFAHNLPFISTARQDTQKPLLCPSLKCTQYHILGVISQRKWFSFPPNALKHTFPERRPCTCSVHACTHAYALYLSLCWANTPLCLTCFSCHNDERHLLFSAETPLHPMLLTSCLHYSRVEWQFSHFSESLDFRDTGWRESSGRLSGSTPSSNLFFFAGRKWSNNVDDFLVNLCSPCIMLFSPGCLS